MMFLPLARTIGFGAIACLTATCARPTIDVGRGGSAARSFTASSELWNEPADFEKRDLLWGAGHRSEAPSTSVEYQVRRLDTSGYSKGYDVVGPDGRAWDIKVGKEAQSEVSVSRILWALGYHQPATYYLADWQLAGTYEDEGAPARFRLESDHESEGEWAWRENPFAASRPFRGLIAVNLVLANWDLKTSNNRVYRVRGDSGAFERRYVVQDLGASLGRFRAFPTPVGTRNEIDDFEKTSLVKEVDGSKVSLDYRGIRGGIFEQMDVADVIWACELLSRLRDDQLDDAFEAAGYEPSVRKRFVQKIRAKTREGLALRSVLEASRG